MKFAPAPSVSIAEHRAAKSVVCLLIVLQTSIAATALASPDDRLSVDSNRVITSRQTVVLDGTINADEWVGATAHELVGGGQLRYRFDGDLLNLGTTGPSGCWVHVFVPSGDTIHVLHASNALGASRYISGKSGKWTIVNGFRWEMRELGVGDSALNTRAAYLNRNGWVASTMEMGRDTDYEFTIDLVRFKNADHRFAVAVAHHPDSIRFWPPNLTDDTRYPELMVGNEPDSLRFSPASWGRLQVDHSKDSTKR